MLCRKSRHFRVPIRKIRTIIDVYVTIHIYVSITPIDRLGDSTEEQTISKLNRKLSQVETR